jgi:hypothetical protein
MSLTRFRIGAYVTLLGWYLITSAAPIGWAYWEAVTATPSQCTDCGFYASLFFMGVAVPVVLWLVIGAVTGCALVGRRMTRTEPTTLAGSFRLGTAVAGISSLIGLAGLAALCALFYGLAYLQHILR